VSNQARLQQLIAAGILILALGTGTALSPNGGDWGLHIAILDVGQADAIAIVSPDGDACVIDAGRDAAAGRKLATFLQDASENGVGDLSAVKMGFATHYDADHIGGFDALHEAGVTFGAVYDQGPSLGRRTGEKSAYGKYVSVVGDPNGNLEDDDANEEGIEFVRQRAAYGLHWTVGDAQVQCVTVTGDTKDSAYDIAGLDPSAKDIDENPGSIGLLVTLNDFEFYTAGDQTSHDWKTEPDTEVSVVNSGALGAENDIDVLKVSHHGSDTSTGAEFVKALDPEVAVISSTYAKDKLPKMVSIKQLVGNHALVFITGDGTNPDTHSFTDAKTKEDDGFTPPDGTVVNEAGDVHIIVAQDGSSYRVYASGKWYEFSAVDSQNPHNN